MKMKEVKIGEIFNIENTPSYPKLKIDGGYVDMRDDIVNKSGNCDERDVYIMNCQEIAEKFGDELESVKSWIEEKSKRYLNK